MCNCVVRPQTVHVAQAMRVYILIYIITYNCVVQAEAEQRGCTWYTSCELDLETLRTKLQIINLRFAF